MPEGTVTTVAPEEGISTGGESVETTPNPEPTAGEQTPGDSTPTAEGAAEVTSTEEPAGEGYKGFPSKEEHDAFYADKRRKDRQEAAQEFGLTPSGEATKANLNNPEVQQAISILKEAGVFVTRDELEERERRTRFNAEADALEKEFDGSDGRPKFDTAAVARFGKENRIFNLRAAYTQMNQAKLIDWAVKKARETAPATEVTGSAGTPGQTGKGMSITDIMSLPEGKEKTELFNKFVKSSTAPQ